MAVGGTRIAPKVVSLWVINQGNIFIKFDVFHASSEKPHGGPNIVPLGNAVPGRTGSIVKMIWVGLIYFPKHHV